MANNHVFDKDSNYKYFPELRKAMEKFEEDDWDNDKVWTFLINTEDEYGDTYEIWIDGYGNYRWDYYIPEVDEDEDDDYHYTPSATRGDYSPSCPWKAPGMSVSDFI